jgi:hypothetical protein
MIPYLAAAVACAYVAAAASSLALFWVGWRRRVIFVAGCLAVLLSPCLIPPNRLLPRFLASVAATLFAVKLYDLRIDLRSVPSISWRSAAVFLANPFALVRRRLAAERRPSWQENSQQLALGLLGLVAGIALLAVLFRIDWRPYPFLAEHCVKVVAFYVAVLGGLDGAVAVWRLLGGTARDYMDRPYAARTPADFWQRYNRPMQQFFYEDIFKPSGATRAPVRAILLTFALSAVMHEYLFGIATSRVQGYQTAFFLLQGCAVAATMRFRHAVRRDAAWKAVGILSTLAFNLVSSVLFFASMNALAPFYSRGLPSWLGGP